MVLADPSVELGDSSGGHQIVFYLLRIRCSDRDADAGDINALLGHRRITKKTGGDESLSACRRGPT